MANLAKSYKHAQSQIGKKGVIVPAADAGDDAYRDFFKQIGQPDLDKFEMKTPDGRKTSPELVKWFKENAHKAGMLPRQAQAFLNDYLKFEDEALTEQVNSFKQAQEQGLTKLEAEWGEAYDREVGKARASVRAAEEKVPGLKEWIKARGLESDPMMIRLSAFYGGMLKEDGLRGENTGKLGAMSPTEIQARIAELSAHPAYANRSHAQHASINLEMEGLYKRLHPTG